MRHAIAALLLLTAAPLAADNRACTSQLVTGGLCVNTSHRLLSYSIPNTDPDGAGPKVGLASEIADAICSPGIGNYQSTLADGAPNPQSCADFADRWIKENFRTMVDLYRKKLLADAAKAAAAADPVPEIQ